jgi:hypothetical protein
MFCRLHLAAILALSAVHSCNHGGSGSFIDASQYPVIQLKSERLDLENTPLFPKGCCVKDSFVPGELRSYNYVLHVSDTLIIVNQTGDHQLTFYNPRTQRSFSKNYFSKIRGVDASDFVYNTQVYDAHYSSSKDRIAIAYKYFKCLDLISKDGTFLKRVEFTNYESNHSRIRKVDAHNVSI